MHHGAPSHSFLLKRVGTECYHLFYELRSYKGVFCLFACLLFLFLSFSKICADYFPLEPTSCFLMKDGVSWAQTLRPFSLSILLLLYGTCFLFLKPSCKASVYKYFHTFLSSPYTFWYHLLLSWTQLFLLLWVQFLSSSQCLLRSNSLGSVTQVCPLYSSVLDFFKKKMLFVY